MRMAVGYRRTISSMWRVGSILELKFVVLLTIQSRQSKVVNVTKHDIWLKSDAICNEIINLVASIGDNHIDHISSIALCNVDLNKKPGMVCNNTGFK